MRRLAVLLVLIAPWSAVTASADDWIRIPVDARSSAGLSTSLRIAPDGLPRLAHWTPGVAGLTYAAFDGAAWQLEAVPLEPSSPLGPTRASGPTTAQLYITTDVRMALDPSGTPWIASVRHDCSDDCIGPVLVTRAGEGGWSTETLETTGGRHGLAISPAGIVWVAYDGPAGIRAARRDGGVWTYEDAATTTGLQQLAVGPDGQPRLLVHGATNGLQLVERSAALWQPRDVPDPAGEHWGATLALAASGHARIAAERRDPVTLEHVLWWIEEQPGGGWHLERIFAAGNAAHMPVITLGPAGDSRIAFRDLANGRARLARRAGGAWQVDDVDTELTTTGGLHVAVDGGGTSWVAWPAGGFGLHSARALAVADAGTPALPAAFSIRTEGTHPALARDVLRLVITTPAPGRVSLEVFDVHGRRLARLAPVTVGAGENRIGIALLARAGVVLVRASDASGLRASARVVVLD